MNNTKQLIQKLKSTKNIKNIRLASSISKIENGYTFGAKEARKKEKNNKKLYKLLLKMYPKEVRERLEEIDKCMLVVVRYFGGIKLGAGKLYRAYLKSGALVVEKFLKEEE